MEQSLSLSGYGSGVSDFPPWIEELALTLAMIWLAALVLFLATLAMIWLATSILFLAFT